jgi:hypothetical protein
VVNNIDTAINYVKAIHGLGVQPALLIHDRNFRAVLAIRRADKDYWDYVRPPATAGEIRSVRLFDSANIWFGGTGAFIRYDAETETSTLVPAPHLGDSTENWILNMFGSSPGDMWGLSGGVLGTEYVFRGDGQTFDRP